MIKSCQKILFSFVKMKSCLTLRHSIVFAVPGHASLAFGQVQAQAEAGDDHQTTGVRGNLPIFAPR